MDDIIRRHIKCAMRKAFLVGPVVPRVWAPIMGKRVKEVKNMFFMVEYCIDEIAGVRAASELEKNAFMTDARVHVAHFCAVLPAAMTSRHGVDGSSEFWVLPPPPKRKAEFEALLDAAYDAAVSRVGDGWQMVVDMYTGIKTPGSDCAERMYCSLRARAVRAFDETDAAEVMIAIHASPTKKLRAL